LNILSFSRLLTFSLHLCSPPYGHFTFPPIYCTWRSQTLFSFSFTFPLTARFSCSIPTPYIVPAVLTIFVFTNFLSPFTSLTLSKHAPAPAHPRSSSSIPTLPIRYYSLSLSPFLCYRIQNTQMGGGFYHWFALELYLVKVFYFLFLFFIENYNFLRRFVFLFCLFHLGIYFLHLL